MSATLQPRNSKTDGCEPQQKSQKAYETAVVTA